MKQRKTYKQPFTRLVVAMAECQMMSASDTPFNVDTNLEDLGGFGGAGDPSNADAKAIPYLPTSMPLSLEHGQEDDE